MNPDVPRASLRERLEAPYPRNGNGSCSQVDETTYDSGAYQPLTIEATVQIRGAAAITERAPAEPDGG